MTDKPDRIFASMESVHQGQGKWEIIPFGISPDSPEYHHSDHTSAMVAAALGEAAEYVYQMWDDDDAQEHRDAIRAIITPDASAALDRAVAKARADALEDALAAFDEMVVEDLSSAFDYPTYRKRWRTIYEVKGAIRAMKENEK